MADNETRDDAKRQRKSPSTGFPSMGLSDAAAAMRRAGAYGYEHQVGALAQYMGHTTTNSGAFKAKLASLRDFGLVVGRGDSLSLSQVAQAIAHPESIQAEREALQEAFFKSDVFAKVYASLAKGHELDVDGIGNAAVRNFGVAAASKQAFIDSFVASAVEARVAERVDDRRIRVLARGVATAPAPEPQLGADGGRVHDPKVVTPPGDEPSAPSLPPAALHQEWEIGDGQLIIEIRSGRPMPAAAYSQIAKLVEAAQQLADLLVPDVGRHDRQQEASAAEIS
jgi:hypothetical protein